MKKTALLFSCIVSLAMVLVPEAQADSVLKLIKSTGSVNKSEIGGNGLYVFSLWGKKDESFVSTVGNFKTVISDSRPQKLSVKDDKGMTRALVMVLPKNAEKIVFDAQSTAAAIFFQDSSSFRSSNEVEKLFRRMDASKSFRKLVAFLQSNLLRKSLEEIINSKECTELLEKCHDEIYGEDSQAIKKSLYDAQGKLEKAFHGE